MIKIFTKIILAIFLLGYTSALAYTSPGKPKGFVNDFAGVVDDRVEVQINAKLKALSDEKNIEISAVTIRNLGGDDISEYANALFREWGIGDKEKNSGVLLLISMEDRKTRIEVGYGLEGALTDAESSYIVRNVINPKLKTSEVTEGVRLGVDAIAEAVSIEDFGGKQSNVPDFFNNLDGSNVLFVIIVILSVLASWLGRSKSYWFGGVLGFGVGFFIALFFLSLGLSLFIGIILGILGLIFDYIVSNHKGGGPGGGWFIGGGGFGGSGGSGGFGGFSGGSSGGGGASGDW